MASHSPAHSRYSVPGASNRLSHGEGLFAVTVTEEREGVGYSPPNKAGVPWNSRYRCPRSLQRTDYQVASVGALRENVWSQKRKARGQLSGTACKPARYCQGAGAPLAPQMAAVSVPVRVPSPGEGVWSSLSAVKFFSHGYYFVTRSPNGSRIT